MPKDGIVGRLSIVATPIGNLEDITLRALKTLKSCDGILAEDTRLTRRLCAHFEIKTKLNAFHAHSNDKTTDRFIQQLQKGNHLALVTDAGTPAISDPGIALVQRALDQGIVVESVPGPSAVTAAIAVSGIRCDAFRFVGFLPRSGARRAKLIKSIAQSSEATVLFESPQRIAQTLTDMAKCVPIERRVALCRELTKVYEQVVNTTLADLVSRFSGETKGEITLVVAGRDPTDKPEIPVDLDLTIATYLEKRMSPRDISRILADETALPRKLIYQRILEIKRADSERTQSAGENVDD